MKKTFVFYNDRSDYLTVMSNEEKGVFFQNIIDYQNGIDIQIEGGIKYIRPRIKKQLDEDGRKRNHTKDERSVAGKKGAEKRWGAIANDSNCHKNIAKNAIAKKSMAKIAVNVNVNDNIIETIKSKQDIVDLYSQDELLATEQITAKYKFVYEFAEWGYSKIPKNKKGIDEFTNKVAEKCTHAIGKVDRHHLRATLRKIIDRENDNNKKTTNYLSRLNTFLLPKS